MVTGINGLLVVELHMHVVQLQVKEQLQELDQEQELIMEL